MNCNTKKDVKFAMFSNKSDRVNRLVLCVNCLRKLLNDSRYDSTDDLFKKFQMISNEK